MNGFEINGQTIAVVRELGDHMPGGFFIYQAAPPEQLLYANRPVFEIYGCSCLDEFQQLTGYTFRGMVHPDDYRRISDSIGKQIEASEGHMDYAEYRIIRRDGAVRWVYDYGHYIKTDAYGGIYTVFISDITEKKEQMDAHIADQKATISALHQSVEKMHAERITFTRLSQALAGDYFSIYVVDPATEHFMEYSSTEPYASLGIEKEGDRFFETSRRNMDRLIYPEDRDRFMAVFTKERVMSILKRDGSFTTKYRLMLEGSPTYVSLKATLMEDEHGSHIIFGTNNIDAQMKREEEYRRRIADARNRAKNDFLANMSHDIRTPMNAIVGYTNIAKSHLDDPAIIRDSLDKISSSSHFLLSLINDVLDISKIESGEMQLNPGRCDLSAIFRRIEDITSIQARTKSLHITYERKNIRHLLVKGDEWRIEQVLINLISNAIKYTPEGKSVALTAEELDTAQEGISRYRFIIRDTGIGISEEYLPYIFDSFTREQKTTINKIPGAGLGLAISARVAEQMGGTITVRSRLGEGSEFTVELPLQILDGSPEESSAEGSAVGRSLKGRRILLVEDNDINAEIATVILTQNGMEVERADNGQIGFEKVRQMGLGYYDAVLMDLQMPVMNGYECARAIRALSEEYYRRLPIIAVSANAFEDDVRNSLQAGMNAHLAKPYRPEDLLRQLQTWIET